MMNPWVIVGLIVFGFIRNFSRQHGLTRRSRALGLNLYSISSLHLVSRVAGCDVVFFLTVSLYDISSQPWTESKEAEALNFYAVLPPLFLPLP